MPEGNFNVFISWSKTPALEIAEETKELLERIFPDPNISFFVSSSSDNGGINAGDRFRSVLDKNLETSNFGILILTKNNYSQPWLLFEAGALSKDSQISKIVPVLFTREKENIEDPLTAFNFVRCSKGGFEELIYSIKMSQFDTQKLKIEQKNSLNDMLSKHWENYDSKIKEILAKPSSHIEEITENPTSLMMDENAYEKILSKRDTHLEELISNLENDMSKRIIIFGGISTKLREEKTINILAKWLINNQNSKIYFCHENSDVAKKRANDLNDSVYKSELNKELEIQKRKVEEFSKMKTNLLRTIGEKFRKNIHFVEIVKSLSIYVTIHGNVVYFTPVLDKRSSDTFTFKLKKSQLINDIIDYIISRIDNNNHGIIKELNVIKLENND